MAYWPNNKRYLLEKLEKNKNSRKGEIKFQEQFPNEIWRNSETYPSALKLSTSVEIFVNANFS
jgi:hypothetical protein